MPRKAKVDVSEAVDAICIYGDELRCEKLPPYTNEFYTKVSACLQNKWTRHDVYINLRENRRQLRTKVFEKLGIENIYEKRELCTDSLEPSDDPSEPDEKSNENLNGSSLFSTPLLDGEEFFDFVIQKEIWNKIQPVEKNYNGRVVLVLPPGVWSDVIADEFWKQYRMPCAFSFKKHFVSQTSENTNTPFITIVGKCKSNKCNNNFFAVAKSKPIENSDLWLQVKCIDTRLVQHEEVKRQLRFEKRKAIGQIVLKHGAANTRRQIALEMQNIGDFPAPNLYKNEVLRKVLQELRDKELNINPKDGTDPITILLKLQNRTPYFGSIKHISASKFQLQYLIPEQIFVFKEYNRLSGDASTVCVDATSSLVTKIDLPDNITSPTIFYYRIVINFNNITLSVGQMLSAAQDTVNIAYWLLNWVKCMKTVPREAVSDYSKALLGAMMLSFNTMTLKAYITKCFEFATSEKNNKQRDIKTYIRVDVAHLIQIFCRLKCFTKCSKAVKDFLIQCVALMISCDDFDQFQDILLCTFIVSIHQYDGNCLKSTAHSPAKTARLKLLNIMSTEEHRAFKLIPDEKSEEFQQSSKKLIASGLDPNNPQCFIHQQADVDANILMWLTNLKEKAEVDKNKKHEEANAYYMPKFFNHIFELSKEFPLWTSVNRKDFSSPYIRPTSCYVESAFSELKNNVLNNVHGAIRCDKFFKFDFGSSKAQCLIAAAEIAKIQMGTSLLDLNTQKTELTTIEIQNEENVTVNSPVHEDNKELERNVTINSSVHEDNEELERNFTINSSVHEDNEELEKNVTVDSQIHENNKELERIVTINSSVHEDNEELGGNVTVNSPVHEDNEEIESFDENFTFLPKHQSTALDLEIDVATNIPVEIVNKDLFAFENWKNKAVEEKQTSDFEIVVTDLKLAKTLDQKHSIKEEVDTAEKEPLKFMEPSAVIVKESKIDKIIEQKVSKKRKIEIKERKPSKFFRKCPNIMLTQNAAIAAAKINIKKPLLLNGNKFSQPIIFNQKKFMILNTCAFDSIIQIITCAAIDNPHYLRNIEQSLNETFGFVLVFLEYGAVNHVYGLRCCILKDFQASSEKQSKSMLKFKEMSRMLQTINCFCNVTEMWEFLMRSEPSIYLTMFYTCGHCKIEEIPSIYINHRIIEQEGFKNLQNAIITHTERNPSLCQKDNCGFNISTRLTINAHVFIELDARATKDITKSLTCKMEDLPLQINLQGTILRLGGVITHHEDHYMARCKRLNGRWELYNDCSTKVTYCDRKGAELPAAAIYIKSEQ